MIPSFWLRLKRRLVKFRPAFLPMAEYVAFKRLPLLKSYVSTEAPHWRSSRSEPRLVTEKFAYNRRKVRRLLQDDTALQNLLGCKDHVVEVLIRENRALIAVFTSHDTLKGALGRVFAYNSRAEQQGNFRFVWTNNQDSGSFGLNFDFHVVHPQNNPIVDPHNPLFIYRPETVE